MKKLTSRIYPKNKSTRKLISRKLISLRYLIHIFDTKFQMQEIPETAAERCRMALSKIAYLTLNFCLGLLRPFAVSFCLCTADTTHFRDILLPDILLPVLQFFQVLFDFAIFTPPNRNFLSNSKFSETYYTFCF